MHLRSVFGPIFLQSFDAVLSGLSLHQHRAMYSFVVMGEYALKIALLRVAVNYLTGRVYKDVFFFVFIVVNTGRAAERPCLYGYSFMLRVVM